MNFFKEKSLLKIQLFKHKERFHNQKFIALKKIANNKFNRFHLLKEISIIQNNQYLLDLQHKDLLNLKLCNY